MKRKNNLLAVLLINLSVLSLVVPSKSQALSSRHYNNQSIVRPDSLEKTKAYTARNIFLEERRHGAIYSPANQSHINTAIKSSNGYIYDFKHGFAMRVNNRLQDTKTIENNSPTRNLFLEEKRHGAIFTNKNISIQQHGKQLRNPFLDQKRHQ